MQRFPPTVEELEAAAVGAETSDLSGSYGPDRPAAGERDGGGGSRRGGGKGGKVGRFRNKG